MADRVKVTTTVSPMHVIAMKIVMVPASKLLERAIEEQVRSELSAETSDLRRKTLRLLLTNLENGNVQGLPGPAPDEDQDAA